MIWLGTGVLICLKLHDHEDHGRSCERLSGCLISTEVLCLCAGDVWHSVPVFCCHVQRGLDDVQVQVLD